MTPKNSRGALTEPVAAPPELKEPARRACLRSARLDVVRPRGAAVLSAGGKVIAAPEDGAPEGSGSRICAERSAILRAVAEGRRRFRAVLIRGGPQGKGDGGAPCGACLQVLYEFAPGARVWWGTERNPRGGMTVRELLPEAFRGPDSGGGSRRSNQGGDGR